LRISKAFRFEAAHRLATWPTMHKCHRLHGHSYRVIITLKGPVDPSTNAVCDFSEISTAWRDNFQSRFDHHNLNDVLGVKDVTAEFLAATIFHGMEQVIRHVDQVTVFETEDAWATYEGRRDG